MSLLDQSGVTRGGLDPYNVHALFINMNNMWVERFGYYDCLVCTEIEGESIAIFQQVFGQLNDPVPTFVQVFRRHCDLRFTVILVPVKANDDMK